MDIAIETDRGLLVAALRAAGHRLWGINPKAVDRYRDRHANSRAKSDSADALVLANILRTDRHAHHPLPADSDLARGIAVPARAHQDTVWRRCAEANRLRNLLREYGTRWGEARLGVATPGAHHLVVGLSSLLAGFWSRSSCVSYHSVVTT
jgi:Transposase